MVEYYHNIIYNSYLLLYIRDQNNVLDLDWLVIHTVWVNIHRAFITQYVITEYGR